MIQATELRIGNLVTSKQWKGFHKINGIELTDVGCTLLIKGFKHDFIPGKYFDIEPIPLTPEILSKKMGFEKIKYDYWQHIESKIIIGTKLNESQTLFFSTQFIFININYVHQLQNLFHALTGKELIFEL